MNQHEHETQRVPLKVCRETGYGAEKQDDDYLCSTRSVPHIYIDRSVYTTIKNTFYIKLY